MKTKLSIFLVFLIYTVNSFAEESYSREEINMKFEIMQERVNSKLDAIVRENNSIDSKLAYQDKQIENLKFIFGILLSLLTIIISLGAIFINNRNKERFTDFENEMKEAKDDALQELKRIKDIANLEVRMAKSELNEVKFETKKMKQDIKNNNSSSNL